MLAVATLPDSRANKREHETSAWVEIREQCTTSWWEMRQPFPLALLLAVSVAFPAFAAGPSALMRATAGLSVVKDPRFAAGTQLTASAGALVELTGKRGFGGGLTLEYDVAAPSAPRDLVSYRGSAGLRVGAFAAWEGSGGAGRLAAGVRLGLVAALLRYEHTELTFVAPGITMEPLVSLHLRRPAWLRLDVGLPVAVFRRADLSIAVSAGLAIGIGVRAVPPPAGAPHG